MYCALLLFFFFSSRRRHTIFDCDWSSDVCSSDLRYALRLIGIAAAAAAAVIIACETDTPPVGPVDSISQLVVSPHTVTLQPGEVQAFMAVGFTAAGDTAQINVTWSVTGGSLVDTSSTGGRHYGDYERSEEHT